MRTSPAGSAQKFEDGYTGYDSQQFDSFSNFADSESIRDSAAHGSPPFTSQPMPESPSPSPIYVSGGEFGSDPAEFSSGVDGEPLNGGYTNSNGPILPPPSEMQEEGQLLREWRRQNATRLEEKEKKEKESLSQILAEADEYKIEFYKKREITCATNKTTNREKEKVFVANHEKFHAEADKNYWKSIAELIPNEVPAIEKKRAKKDQEKKPSIVVIQGPKPGKPTDLSRMRHVLLRLKHNTPSHLKHSPPPAPATTKDPESESSVASKDTVVTATPEPVAVA